MGHCVCVTSSLTALFPNPPPSSFVFIAEQILNNIKQEYKRIQKRKHLDCCQQAEGCYSPDSPSQPSLMSAQPSLLGLDCIQLIKVVFLLLFSHQHVII